MKAANDEQGLDETEQETQTRIKTGTVDTFDLKATSGFG